MLPSQLADLSPRSEADQQGFFDDVLARARAAEAACGAIARDLVIAGQRLRLVFAGAALEALLLPALAHHLRDNAGTPDVTLHLWDSVASGVAMAPPPVAAHCFSDRGDIWSFGSRRFRSAFHLSEYSLNLLDLERGEGVYWLRTTAGVPYWTQASPLRTLLHWWFAARGCQLVHAAAVGTPDGGVLITGRGGVGKSTTALACLAAGFDHAGDDYVLVALDPPRAYSLYRTAKVDAAGMARFAAFAPRLLGTAGDEKAVIFIADDGPGRLVDRIDLTAVLTPRFGSAAETGFEAADGALLAGAATYSTLAQLPHSGQDTVDFIADLLGRLRGYTLVLGNDIARVPAAIAQFLAKPRRAEMPRAATDPLVSVIIPVCNGAHFLGDAVATVLAQDHTRLEIIVVDDGSTDAIEAAVAALPVEVRLLRQANRGAAAARNLGIRAASAEFVALLDVDDLWPPGTLSARLGWLVANPASDVVVGRAQLLEAGSDGEYGFVGSPAEAYGFYLGAALYRRRAFELAGLFDPLLRLAEDTDWFIRARAAGLTVDRIEVVTLHVRRHAGNLTRDLAGPDLLPLRVVRNALQRKRASLP